MKKIVSLLLAVVMVIGSLAALTACGEPDDYGAEISIYLGDKVFDLDPSDYYVSTNAEQILSLIYEPLFKVDEDGDLENAAAKKYEIIEEERKIVITIADTYWSDGVQLKSEDFWYAWCERIINPSNPNPAATLFYGIEGVRGVMNGIGSTSDIGIKATETKTLEITYCKGIDPESVLLNLASIATAPIRQDVVEKAPTYWSKSSVDIVTNGPFKVKTNNSENSFELTRNLGFHQDPLTTDYDNIVTPGLLYTTFTTADDDITVSYADIENKVTFIMTDAPLGVRAENKSKAETADHTSVYTYVFNTSKPLFSDVNVRLALSCAIDRSAIINAITFGKAADGFLPDVSSGSSKALISATADLDLAKEYLAKADQSVVNANKSFTICIDTDAESAKIAEIVSAAWGELGFTVNVVALESIETNVYEIGGTSEEAVNTFYDSGVQATVLKTVSGEDVDFDVLAVDWQTYSRDAAVGLSTLTSDLNGCGVEYVDGDTIAQTAGYTVRRANISGWTDTVYDNLVNNVRNCASENKEAAVDAAEEYLIANMPVCPLVFNQNFVFSSSEISHIDLDGNGNFIFTEVKLDDYEKHLKPEDED